MRATDVLVTPSDLERRWPALEGVAAINVDLRAAAVDLAAARVDGAVFLGCTFPPGAAERLVANGAAVLSHPGGVPFPVYRASLYSPDELTGGHDADPGTSLDARITAWFHSSSSTSLTDLVVRALHDATIDAATARFVAGRRVVGVMGGHALARDDDLYREVAGLGRELTRRGFTVATGGGPGVMEAANLGAWCAPLEDAALDGAVAMLSDAPVYGDDPSAHIGRARDVRVRWPDGGVSLGVPTWIYAHEPTSGFATHIA